MCMCNTNIKFDKHSVLYNVGGSVAQDIYLYIEMSCSKKRPKRVTGGRDRSG